jgi:hypothetical protein
MGGRAQDSNSHKKHAEAVLPMLEPAFDAARIAARRLYRFNASFKRRQGFRVAVDVLRTAKGPLRRA